MHRIGKRLDFTNIAIFYSEIELAYSKGDNYVKYGHWN